MKATKLYRVVMAAQHKAWAKDVHLVFYAKANNETEAAEKVEGNFDLSALRNKKLAFEVTKFPEVWQESGDVLAVRR